MEKIKLLYAEDEVFLGRIVKESLESRGFEICMIGDGRQVMAGFREFRPHVCVLDIMMPNRDGYELAQEIRALDPQVPILFLTAKTQTEDVLKGFLSGGNDYIKKPFSMEELIVRIQNLYRLSHPGRTYAGYPHVKAPGTTVTLGAYRYIPSGFELHFGDQVRKLSHREAELLEILVENRNYRVLRKDILMRVWGDDSFFNSRNLDVYITRLREYLRKDPALEIITLKGVGYLFKESGTV